MSQGLVLAEFVLRLALEHAAFGIQRLPLNQHRVLVYLDLEDSGIRFAKRWLF